MKPTYEELEARCAALAAENMGLKAAASCLVSEYMMNKGTDSEFIACITPSKKTIGTGGAWDMWRHLDLTLNKSPATNAFLAEVRTSSKADGVQEYADSFRHSASKHRELYGESIRVKALLHEAGKADEFAAQLRNGGK